MSLVQQIKEASATAINNLYTISIPPDDVAVNQTKPEFEGEYTVVLFALVKQLRKSPEQLGKEMGDYLVENNQDLFTSYNVIKGFLNLSVNDFYFTQFLARNFSSPELMKPSASHKSMIAWQLFGNGDTPQSTGIKGDHFVGDYYVKFNNEHKDEMQDLVAAGQSKEEAERNAPIMQKTQQMLVDWEKGDPQVRELWRKMNGWVYEGFDVTYKRIGSDFDKTYYESETYLLGREFVEMGLKKGVFYKKEDSSVWINLTDEGLDEKLVLRKDGTSVYITQDLGLAHQKYEQFHYDQSIYVVGDEQNYHMKVLKLILKKLGMPYADGIYHLSYGMVELPSGRMKSREGTVVDADDLVDEMVKEAEKKTNEKSKVEEFSNDELKELYETIALGALKFFLLKVDPKKRMVFNPEESIDFHGFTGPFIQYTHARIKSILRKEPVGDSSEVIKNSELLKLEKALLVLLEQYPEMVHQAAMEYNPSAIANYIYSVAQTYNTFYTVHSVLKAENEEKKQLRLQLCRLTATVIKDAMHLLGIKVPERM